VTSEPSTSAVAPVAAGKGDARHAVLAVERFGGGEHVVKRLRRLEARRFEQVLAISNNDGGDEIGQAILLAAMGALRQYRGKIRRCRETRRVLARIGQEAVDGQQRAGGGIFAEPARMDIHDVVSAVRHLKLLFVVQVFVRDRVDRYLGARRGAPRFAGLDLRRGPGIARPT
jgi:hypothetical protein